MNFFGKKKISAEEFGIRLLHESLVLAGKRWPTAQKALMDTLNNKLGFQIITTEFLNDPWTMYYFSLASITMQIQSVRNLLDQTISIRVIDSIMTTLGNSKDVGDISVEFVNHIDTYWKDSIKEGVMPTVAFPLLQCIIDDGIDIEGDISDPLVILAVETVVGDLVPGMFCKEMISKYSIN